MIIFSLIGGEACLKHTYSALKTGYMRKEPEEYRFLLRYPPLSRDTAPPVQKLETRQIPYINLYQKIVSSDPIMRNETVFPAYWQEEPVALTMAKKQYELMTKQKMSEEEALRAAKRYVSDLENKAYEEMIGFKKSLDDRSARESLTSKQDLMIEINKYRALLRETPYEDLDLADQGDIDYFIQTKVLGWREVERNRRMKDPLFVWQFERIRAQIFPEIFEDETNLKKDLRGEYKKRFAELYGLELAGLKAASPFYYEDYEILFNKCRDRPHLARWNERPREHISRWILDTLALQTVVRNSASQRTSLYLDELRAQFFPMIKYPQDALSFTLPSAEKMKEILYNNDIGYKVVDNKLYIRRFYLLPALLFPKQTYTTKIIYSQTKLTEYVSDKKALLKELRSAGFDEVSQKEIEKRLEEYVQRHPFGANLPKYGSIDKNFLTSSLEALMNANDKIILKEQPKSPVVEDLPAASEAALAQSAAAENVEERSDTIIVESTSSGEDEWDKLVREKYPAPANRLEQDRDDYLRSQILIPKDASKSLEQAEIIEGVKLSTKVMVSARLTAEFEEKDAARRRRLWSKRAAFTEETPIPDIDME